MKVFLLVLGLIMVAELGDKTQFLAVALACRYRWQPVLGGIVLAILILMGLAVILGNYLLALLPELALKIIAGCLFLFFGVYTLWERGKKGEEKVKNKLSPFWATFLTFFLSELGDKTQLMTMALSAEYKSPFLVWLGASLAMILVDGVAVFLGNRLGKVIPVRTLSYVAAALFLIFGVLTLLSTFIPALSF
ncbi:MAG: TMEM165/GDT1 family protein [Caldiserica bacterium]|nr:TMEM165/GDT1 family protein [Caldisericota bacterium]